VVEAALFEALNRGVSLTQAVHEQYPALAPLLESALDRSDFPAIHTVRPLAEVVRVLPAGMPERLLALPVHRDALSGRIDVAAVDVLDGHIASEFQFHLGVPVRVLRASFPELVVALEGLHAAGIFLPGLSKSLRTDSSSFRAISEHPPERPDRQSAPPMLLVRRPLVASPAWVPEVPAVSFDVDAAAPEDPAEPVLSLLRSKPFIASEPALAGPPWALEFEQAVAALETASSPEQVVTALCEGLRPVRALVLAVRNASFDVRGGSAALGDPSELRALSVPSGNGSLLDATARVGYFLGPLARLAVFPSLESKWDALPGSDCYARTVNVSERPSLILLMAGFSESAEATRRADVLARSAGSALERIVRSRKKG